MHSEMCPTNLEVLARIGTAEEPRVPTLTSDAFFFFQKPQETNVCCKDFYKIANLLFVKAPPLSSV